MRAFAIAMCLGGAATVAAADVVQLGASKDNTMFEAFGDGLSNGAGPYMFAGETRDFGSRRALLAFDIASAVPAGSTINSVSLQLRMSRSTTGARPVALHRVLADWGEGTSDSGDPGGGGAPATPGDATWVYRFYQTDSWATPGGDFDPTASASTNVGGIGFYTWSSGGAAGMLADVQAWLDDPSSNFGWVLIGADDGTRSAKRFDSRENPNPAYRPVLIIDYTPVPAPGSALVAALGVVAALRRRRG